MQIDVKDLLEHLNKLALDVLEIQNEAKTTVDEAVCRGSMLIIESLVKTYTEVLHEGNN